MSQRSSLREGVGAAPTTDDASPALLMGDDDDDNLLSIKVRSHDPAGEYEFSVSKTVRRKCSHLSSSKLFFPPLS